MTTESIPIGFEPIATAHRRIVSAIPHPASRAVIDELRRLEPRSMDGMPPVVWARARGFSVEDGFGNRWIDFTSAVLLANAGHAHPRIEHAIRTQLDEKLWHHYCNPSAVRLQAVKSLAGILPPYLDKVFLLTTGSEATECAIKLMRIHGRSIHPEKIHIVSFSNAFHGRTMASQTAGGYPDQQDWMGQKPGGFHHLPFPECARCPWKKGRYEHCGAECFHRGLETLRSNGLRDELVAGVISETFQGPTVAFLPLDYARALRDWTDKHHGLLVFDEIQAGFGRTGRWFGFEHYAVRPDLICLGKGMTSCLPMSAVAGRAAVMDLPEHGQMSSTHTGNPLCCAAAIANIETIRDEGLVTNAAELEPLVGQMLSELRRRFPRYVGPVQGKGLVWAVYLLDPATGKLNGDLARRVTTRCMELGLLMLQTDRGTLKIAPPLCITPEAMKEGLEVIDLALARSI